MSHSLPIKILMAGICMNLAHSGKPSKLPYTPKPPSPSCKPPDVDLGPHPNESILEGLSQHMQVALEQTCTSGILACAYQAGPSGYDIITEALGDLFLKGKIQKRLIARFEDGLEKGLKAMKISDPKYGRKCRQTTDVFLQNSSTSRKELMTAWGDHFKGYNVTTKQVWNAQYRRRSFEDMCVSLCDQIGNDSDGKHAEALAKHISAELFPDH